VNARDRIPRGGRQTQRCTVNQACETIPFPGSVLPSGDPCTSKMKIGHLNLIRLVLLALLLWITVGPIYQAKGYCQTFLESSLENNSNYVNSAPFLVNLVS